MTRVTPMTPMTRPKTALGPLTPDDISFLALEGGGGKGVAFLGAIEALEELDVLRHRSVVTMAPPAGHLTWLGGEIDPGRRLIREDGIEGIAGASAGAITALMLSCGYDAADIRRIMSTFDFDTFFEPSRPRKIPRISGRLDPHDREAAVELPVENNPIPEEIKPLLALFALLPGPIISSARRGPRHLPAELPQIGSGKLNVIIDELWARFLTLAPFAIRDVAKSVKFPLPPAADVLLDDFDDFMNFLPKDMGLFAGYAARAFFADLLAFKMPRRNGKLQYNATFKDHYDCFQIELAVTGTNIESGKSGIFSYRTTPNFPVADAVRISMSLPLAYKPYVIRKEHYEPLDLPQWVDGVWIDGGYLNNLPLHVFDQDGGIHRTLGLRLEIEEVPKMEHFGDFLAQWPLKMGFLGAGEAHIGPGTRNNSQTIVLDTKGLDLLKFSYPAATIDEVSKRSRKQVIDYFPYLTEE
jgi:NTE family protein